MRLVKHLCLILAFLCALPLAALAQNGGSIDGTITDPNGAVVPGAAVTATQAQTGYSVTANTTQAGVYNFPALPTGPYSITVKQSGFKTLVRAGIEVRVGLNETIDFKLELGTVQQTVQVRSAAPVLETVNATRGTGVSARTLDVLPLFSSGLRLANSFIGYMPGVNSNGETSINGSTGRASEVMIDGGSMVNPESGGVVFYFPGMEPYGEFKLQTSGFTAENGRVGGGIQEFISKSGTNQFHGSAFFNFKRQFFDAVAWSNNQNPAQRGVQNANGTFTVPVGTECRTAAVATKACRPMERYNEEGGAAGGPIYIPKVYDGRNKSFFYFTWAGFWQPSAVTVNGSESTPTAAMLQGNFAGLTNSAGPVIIYDPATTGLNGNAPGVRSAFAGNIIPQARFSAIAKNIIPYIPGPNAGGGSVNPAGNYTYNSQNIATDKDWSIKVDHTIRTNHHIAFFYTHRINQTVTDQYFPGPLSNGLRSPNAPKQLRLSHDWVVNPHVVLHSFFSLSTDNQTWFTDLQTGFGCKFGFNNLPCGTVSDVTPVISFQTDLTVPAGAGNSFSGSPFTCSTCLTWGMDQGKVNNGGQLNWTSMGGQTLSWVRNKHEFKFGWDVRRMRTFGHDLASSNGTYMFNQAQTAISSGNTLSGNSFASFLLGDVNQAASVALPVSFGGIRYGYHAGFVQDTWRVKPKLTVDIGLRYEVPIGWHFYNGNDSSFSPTVTDVDAGNLPGGLIFQGSGPGRTGTSRPYPTDFSDIGPRVGFAYQVTSNTVIRSSFGIFYEGLGNGGCGCTDGFNGYFTQGGNGFDPTFQWDGNGSAGSAGVHPPLGFKPPPSTDPGFDNYGAGLYYKGGKYGKAPRVYDYNLTIQRQYKGWLFEAAYSGNRAHGLSSSEFINTVPDSNLYLANLPAALTQGGVTVPAGTNLLNYSFKDPTQGPILNALGYYAPSGLNSKNPSCAGWVTCWTSGWGSPTLGQSLRPYPQYGTIYSANSGDGWIGYDSLQMKVEHRFGDLNFESSFVWSKTMDMMAYRQIFTQCCTEQTQDAQNIPDSKTLSNSDLPFVVNFTMSYALPLGRGKKFLGNSNSVVNKLVGGWTAAGLGQYRTGALIQLTSPANNLGTYLGEPLTKALNTGAPIKTNIATNSLDPNNPATRWFTTTSAGTSASFVDTPRGALGTASIYNTNFRQPWYRYEAISLNKNIGIYGEGRVYLRYSINVFNPFNRTSFAGIQGSITSANFGRPTAAYDAPRNISMGLRLYF